MKRFDQRLASYSLETSNSKIADAATCHIANHIRPQNGNIGLYTVRSSTMYDSSSGRGPWPAYTACSCRMTVSNWFFFRNFKF